jgi:hypothetical protein
VRTSGSAICSSHSKEKCTLLLPIVLPTLCTCFRFGAPAYSSLSLSLSPSVLQDCPELLRHSAYLLARSDHSSTTSAGTEPILTPEERQARERRDYTTRAYATKLRAMNRDELKQEVLNFNRRAMLCGEGSAKLRHTGTKEDLIARLLRASILTLEGEGTVDVDVESNGEQSGSDADRDTVAPVSASRRNKVTKAKATRPSAAAKRHNKAAEATGSVTVEPNERHAPKTRAGGEKVGTIELSDDSDCDNDSQSSSDEDKPRSTTRSSAKDSNKVLAAARQRADNDVENGSGLEDSDVEGSSDGAEIFSDGESLVEGAEVITPSPSGVDEDMDSEDDSDVEDVLGSLDGSEGDGSDAMEVEDVAPVQSSRRASSKSEIEAPAVCTARAKGRAVAKKPASANDRRTRGARVVLSDDSDGANDSSGGAESGSEAAESDASVPSVKRARTAPRRITTTKRASSTQNHSKNVEDGVVVKNTSIVAARNQRLHDSLDELEVLLRRHFGFSEFRPGQRLVQLFLRLCCGLPNLSAEIRSGTLPAVVSHALVSHHM